MGIFATITNQNVKNRTEVTKLKNLINTNKIYEPSIDDTIDNIVGKDGDLPSLDFVVAVNEFFQESLVNTINGARSSHTLVVGNNENKATLEYNNRNATIDHIQKKVFLGAPCSFVVDENYVFAQGEVLVFISNVVSQTEFDVESTSGLTDNNIIISQKLETINLNALSGPLDGGVLRSVQELIDEKIRETMVTYDDNFFATVSSQHNVAYALTSNNATWSLISTMPNNFEDDVVAVDPPIAGKDLRVAFFANIDSGDGIVDLMSFKVNFHSLNTIQG